MVNISRCFLASAQRLLIQCTNQDMVYEAMKRVTKKSLEYKHSVHIKNLYGNLKKDGIGTTTVEELSRRICRTLPEHRTKSLVKIITRWKLHNAHDQLRTTVTMRDVRNIQATHKGGDFLILHTLISERVKTLLIKTHDFYTFPSSHYHLFFFV